jgi:hypothetical protein
MGQVLHGCATTTEAIRRAIQHSELPCRVDVGTGAPAERGRSGPESIRLGWFR